MYQGSGYPPGEGALWPPPPPLWMWVCCSLGTWLRINMAKPRSGQLRHASDGFISYFLRHYKSTTSPFQTPALQGLIRP